jgi:hypothetical protein
MTEHGVRVTIAMGVVGGFLLCCLSITLVMLIGYIDARDGLQVLKDFASIFSGIIGLILGYYFGKRGT